MARQINDIHDFIQFIERKQRLAIQSHPEIDDALDAGQMDCFNEYFAGYGTSQKLHDALSVFKAAYTFTNVTNPTGIITLPSDYVHLLNAYTITYDNKRNVPVKNKVMFVNEDELIDAINSQLRPVTASSPIGINNAGAIQLYPESAQAGVIGYLKRPVTPVYAYTQLGRVITYNAAGSTQLQWQDNYLDKIIAKALYYLGINLNAAEIVQFGQLKDKELA